MKSFQLHSSYQPAGDQALAIQQLTDNCEAGEKHQVLLGVTGSGKTFTIANTVQNLQRPTLVLTHNKTLVAQLYGEFKHFFPDNAVECYVSYYDYYQPEAYLPGSNTYIEKDLAINEDLDRLRLSAITKLLSGRKDILIVASVSAIYGAGNPVEYHKSIIRIHRGQIISRQKFLLRLVESLYTRSVTDLSRGQFRVNGDTVDIHLPYLEYGYRVSFFGDEIEEICSIELQTNKRMITFEEASIYPANLYVAGKEHLQEIIYNIQDELKEQIIYFEKIQRYDEAKRIKERVEYDIEMIRELGYCSGIENYSRFFDRREKGTRPFCLMDYFPEDFLCVIDESHQTVPQIRGMYGGDRSRKLNLVEYGFRLPSALDNRPLNFFEVESLLHQTIYVSATPGEYELIQTQGAIVEQVVRPTGLLDPEIIVKPSLNQVDDLLEEIKQRIAKNERVLVTTLTKKMSESLDAYFKKLNIKCMYIHSDVETLDRVEILRNLRLGKIHVLIGVNLLREGLDLPEVSLVAILDADKEGFLRNEKSLTQTAGRAARNVNGKVIFYADKITQSMQNTIDETMRRRLKQLKHNADNHITPKTILKSVAEIMGQTHMLSTKQNVQQVEMESSMVAEEDVVYESKKDLEQSIQQIKKSMEKAAKNLDFVEAARLRDKMKAMQNKA